MDYFSALAERVTDVPSALRPRIATEFEGESSFEDEAWGEVVSEEVAKPVSTGAAVEPGSMEARKDGGDEAPPIEFGQEGKDGKKASWSPEARKYGSEEAPSSAEVRKGGSEIGEDEGKEAIRPLRLEATPLETGAREDGKTRGKEATRDGSEEGPEPVEAPPLVAQEAPLAPTPIAIQREPARPPSRVIQVPTEVVEESKEPVVVDRVSQIEKVKQSSRVIRVPVSIDRPVSDEKDSEPDAPRPTTQDRRPNTEDRRPASPQPAVQVQLAQPQIPTQREVANREPEPERNVVEIHIGRIEVRPPAQPPPRPAPKPSRSRINLDEMLSKRRGGR